MCYIDKNIHIYINNSAKNSKSAELQIPQIYENIANCHQQNKPTLTLLRTLSGSQQVNESKRYRREHKVHNKVRGTRCKQGSNYCLQCCRCSGASLSNSISAFLFKRISYTRTNRLKNKQNQIFMIYFLFNFVYCLPITPFTAAFRSILQLRVTATLIGAYLKNCALLRLAALSIHSTHTSWLDPQCAAHLRLDRWWATCQPTA